MKRFSLERFPLHLGLGAQAVPQPEFSGMEWYAAYAERHAADGREARLVSLYSFSESWTSWERHPAGDEAVICTAGEITLIQELPDGTESANSWLVVRPLPSSDGHRRPRRSICRRSAVSRPSRRSYANSI